MGPDPHPDSPEDGARLGRDSGRAGENQAGTSAQFAAGHRFDTEKAGLAVAAALAEVQAGLGSLDDDELAGFLGQTRASRPAPPPRPPEPPQPPGSD